MKKLGDLPFNEALNLAEGWVEEAGFVFDEEGRRFWDKDDKKWWNFDDALQLVYAGGWEDDVIEWAEGK